MPRGVPKNGFRNTKSVAKNAVQAAPVVSESDEEIDHRITERFEILADLTTAAVDGEVKALIISGPPGLGKSFTVEETLTKWDPDGVRHAVIKGYVRATGLFKLLYANRAKGQVIVFDDADTIWFDDTSLNLLKAVCDSNDRRIVSYVTESNLIDEETADRLPKQFAFEGTIVFITNLDFDAMIDKGHKLAPHLSAMMSRAHYIDLSMKTKRDYIVRIRQVMSKGLLSKAGLDKAAQDDVVKFIETNSDKMRELSIRIALKVASIRKIGGARWEKMATVTCCK